MIRRFKQDLTAHFALCFPPRKPQQPYQIPSRPRFIPLRVRKVQSAGHAGPANQAEVRRGPRICSQGGRHPAMWLLLQPKALCGIQEAATVGDTAGTDKGSCKNPRWRCTVARRMLCGLGDRTWANKTIQVLLRPLAKFPCDLNLDIWRVIVVIVESRKQGKGSRDHPVPDKLLCDSWIVDERGQPMWPVFEEPLWCWCQVDYNLAEKLFYGKSLDMRKPSGENTLVARDCQTPFGGRDGGVVVDLKVNRHNAGIFNTGQLWKVVWTRDYYRQADKTQCLTDVGVDLPAGKQQ